MKQIYAALQENGTTDRDNLGNIADILKLETPKRSVGAMTAEVPPLRAALTINASYRRFLRPSQLERSQFLRRDLIPFQRTDKKALLPTTHFIPAGVMERENRVTRLAKAILGLESFHHPHPIGGSSPPLLQSSNKVGDATNFDNSSSNLASL
jgi:hypothetical protein